MAVPALESAPVLSTPDTHIFEDPTPPVDTSNRAHLSDEQLAITYEIERTVKEIRGGRWKRIALQFPDHMLPDATRVYAGLRGGLRSVSVDGGKRWDGREKSVRDEREGGGLSAKLEDTAIQEDEELEEKLFILGDTSYGACCVDEVAAEHVDADVIVHYGRSCLSPPSRLPVIYVFTEQPFDLEPLISTFKETYPNKEAKVILMADIPYSHHVPILHNRLSAQGYTNIFATELIHNPSSLLPNRTTPTESEDALREYALFHISDPPTSLLLTLSSRVLSTHIYPTSPSSTSSSPKTNSAIQASTTSLLRRRYALLTSLSTTPIFGILINTLSVKNYMHILSHVQAQISAAGKKHYTFVVGKVNAAKVANFSEVGGWVVIGCWESSLMESKEFWRPMITPWELGIALARDEERVWTGRWEADWGVVLDKEQGKQVNGSQERRGEESGMATNGDDSREEGEGQHDYDSEPESAPPEFDLRTGRYVSHSRPMQSNTTTSSKHLTQPSHAPSTSTSAPNSSSQAQDPQQPNNSTSPSTSLTTRSKNTTIASMGGVASPGAEYLRSQRTWQGLGSEFREEDEEKGEGERRAAKMEEGRSGIARGYGVRGEGEGGR